MITEENGVKRFFCSEYIKKGPIYLAACYFSSKLGFRNSGVRVLHEMSFTDGACRQCFIQSLQLKRIAFLFLYAVKPPKMQRFRVRHLGLISTVA